MRAIVYIFICYLVICPLVTSTSWTFLGVAWPFLVSITAIFFGAMAAEVEIELGSSPLPPPGADETTPLLAASPDGAEAARLTQPDHHNSDGPRRHNRFDLIGTWLSLLSAVSTIVFGVAVMFIYSYWRPRWFVIGWGVTSTYLGIMTCVRHVPYDAGLPMSWLSLTYEMIAGSCRNSIHSEQLNPLSALAQDSSYGSQHRD